MITYRIVRGGLHPDGWVIERTLPGERPDIVQSFDTEEEAQAQADRLNIAAAMKES